MNKLFWGFFFIFLNFSLTFNGASLQLLPLLLLLQARLYGTWQVRLLQQVMR